MAQLTTLIILWQNTLPANKENDFFHEIKRDGIASLRGIHGVAVGAIDHISKEK